MNLRQWIIYCCCMFAGLIMLAHALVPHVHHDGVICFIQENAYATSDCDHNHGHNHQHGPFEDCKLKDLQIRPEVNESITPDLSYQFLLTYQFVFFSFGLDLDLYPIELDRESKPYLLLYTSVLADSSHSLRAPPVFVVI